MKIKLGVRLCKAFLSKNYEVESLVESCIFERVKNPIDSSLQGSLSDSENNEAIQKNNSTFGKVLSRDFKGCASERAKIEHRGSLSEANEASPLKSPTRQSQITPPPCPLPQGEGEFLECRASPQPPRTFLKKSPQKSLNLGKFSKILPTLNLKNYDNFGKSRESLQTQYVDFKGQRPLTQTPPPLGRDSTSPSPCGRGQGGGVNFQNPIDSCDSQNLCESKIPHNRTQDSREIMQNLNTLKKDLNLSFIPPLERRRLSNASKVAFALFNELKSANLATMPIIFSSEKGEINRCFGMLKDLALHNLTSPTAFSLSVLNATPAMCAIAHKNKSEIVAISAKESLEYALISAYTMLYEWKSLRECAIVSYFEGLGSEEVSAVVMVVSKNESLPQIAMETSASRLPLTDSPNFWHSQTPSLASSPKFPVKLGENSQIKPQFKRQRRISANLGSLENGDLDSSDSRESCHFEALAEKSFLNDSTPPPNPLPQGEGEVIDSLGVAQTHLLFASQKVSKKTLDFGDSSNSIQTHCGDFKGQRPTQYNTSPSPCGRGLGGGAISQNNESMHDSRESKNFLPTFYKSRWAEAQNKTSPSIAEGVRGRVKSKNLKDSHKSQKSRESKNPIDCHALPNDTSRNDDGRHKSLRESCNDNKDSRNSHESHENAHDSNLAFLLAIANKYKTYHNGAFAWDLGEFLAHSIDSRESQGEMSKGFTLADF